MSVRPHILTSSPGFRPSAIPETRAAKRSAVPAADKKFADHSAASGSGFGVTGGIRMTALCKSGMASLGEKMPSSDFFTAGTPHRKTNTDKSAHGIHARADSPRVGAGPTAVAAPSWANRQVLRG